MVDKQRIHSMDFMRVMSIFMIITFHLYVEWMRLTNAQSDHFFSTFGTVGVSFFIIISGGALAASTKSNFNLKSFYVKRISTIYPAFWISYIFAFFYIWLINGRLTGGTDPRAVLISFFGFDGYLHSMYETYYLVGEWFLGFIITIYLMYPAVRFLYLKNKWLTLALSIAIAYVSITFNSWLFENTPFWNKFQLWNPTARLPEFIFGMILFDAIKEGKLKPLNVFIIAIIIISTTHYFNIGIHKPMATPSICSMFMVIATLYDMLKTYSSVNKFISEISKLSFSAFLIHHVVIQQIIPAKWIASSNGAQLSMLLFLSISLSFFFAAVINPACESLKLKILNTSNVK